MKPASIFTSALLFLVLAVGGCKAEKKGGIFTQMPEPSVNGSWSGTLNTATSTATLTISVLQDTLNIDGTYEAPLSQAALFGTEGIVEGVTTGSSFLVTLTPDDPGCPADLQISGTNDGSEMQFSFTGVDCASNTFSGQGYFTKN